MLLESLEAAPFQKFERRNLLGRRASTSSTARTGRVRPTGSKPSTSLPPTNPSARSGRRRPYASTRASAVVRGRVARSQRSPERFSSHYSGQHQIALAQRQTRRRSRATSANYTSLLSPPTNSKWYAARPRRGAVLRPRSSLPAPQLRPDARRLPARRQAEESAAARPLRNGNQPRHTRASLSSPGTNRSSLSARHIHQARRRTTSNVLRGVSTNGCLSAKRSRFATSPHSKARAIWAITKRF